MATQQVIHEAEVQRQHSRYFFPVKVTIGHKTWDAADWSVGGVGIEDVDWQRDLGDIAAVGNTLPIELLFDFNHFKFTLPVKAEIRNYSDAVKRLGLKLIDLTPQKTALLRYFMDAYMGGEVVQTGDILAIAERNQSMASRNLPPAPQAQSVIGRILQWGRHLLAYGIAIAAFAILLILIGSSLYQKLFLVPASNAYVSADVTVIAAPVAGQLTVMLDSSERNTRRGRPILGIDNGSEIGVTVDAPCDCQIIKQAAQNGSFVDRGQALMILAPQSAKPYLVAQVTAQQALELKAGTAVQVKYAGSSESETATVREIRRHSSMWTESGQGLNNQAPIEIVMEPQRNLPLTSVGTPLVVTFDTFANSAVGTFVNNALGL